MDLGQLKRTGSDGRRKRFCLQLLSLSCQGERNRWQIITKAGSHGLAEVQFFSHDLFKFLTRRQHAGSTVWLHVSHAFESQRLTNSGPKPETQVENYAARLTVQFVVKSTLTLIEGQHRRGATLVGMDVILLLVQHLHALICQFKTWKQIDSIGLFRNEFDSWCWCFVEISCCCEIICSTTSCLHTKQARPITFIFPCGKTIDIQPVHKLTCNLLLAYCAANWSHFVGSSSWNDSFHQTTQVLQILLVNYIITTWFLLTLPCHRLPVVFFKR